MFNLKTLKNHFLQEPHLLKIVKLLLKQIQIVEIVNCTNLYIPTVRLQVEINIYYSSFHVYMHFKVTVFFFSLLIIIIVHVPLLFFLIHLGL